MLIDTHCHLSYAGLAENVPAVLERAASADVQRVISIGTHLSDHAPALAIARRHPAVFAALGVHPHHAAEVPCDWESLLESSLKHPKILAVGECGLDYHYDFSPRSAQQKIFEAHLHLAQKLRLPVVLHVREAHDDGLAMVRQFPELRYVVHCFTGTPEECRRWLDRGAFIGITGIVTYKNAADVRQDAALIPADRLLLETDGPYLSPEPVRKVKTNEPAHLRHIAAFVAALRHTSLPELARQTTQNAERLFGESLTGAFMV